MKKSITYQKIIIFIVLSISTFFLITNHSIATSSYNLKPELVCFNLGSSTIKTTLYADGQKIKKIKIRTKLRSYIKDHVLSKDGINTLFEAFSQMQSEYGINCTKIRCIGIATSWSRTAKNGYKTIDDLNLKFNTNIKPISQEDEGIRAFKGVEQYLRTTDVSTQGLVVLDVGGGSYQVSYKIDDQVVVKGQEYSVENETLKKFGDKLLNTKEIAIMKSMTYKSLQSVLKNIPKRKIGYALGRPMTRWPDFIAKKGYITKNEANDLAISLSNMSKEEAFTKFPNMPPISMQRSAIFIQSLMKGLKINKIYFAEDIIDFCLAGFNEVEINN